MSVGPLIVEIVCVCCLTVYLLHRYGDWRKQHVLVTIAVFVAWYFSLLIVFVLPLDVSNTCYRQCQADHGQEIETESTVATSTYAGGSNSTEAKQLGTIPTGTEPTSSLSPIPEVVCKKPLSFVQPALFRTLWRVVYWTSQVLTWLVLPMMQSYAKAGDFSVIGKIKSSLIENAIYYGTYLLIFGVCLIYVLVKIGLSINGSQLKVLAITASNTWGLFLLVLLLGYGLVEVPRSLWNNSKKGGLLNYTYFRIAKLSTEKTEAEENLEDVLDDVKKAAETIRYNHSFRKYVDTILLKCPESVQAAVKRNKDDYEDYNNPTETPTEKSLVRLHKRVIRATQAYRRTQCQWSNLMNKAIDLENIAANEGSNQQSFAYSTSEYNGIFKACYSPTLEWYWKCWIRPWSLRVLAVVLIIFSIMVVWSECLFFIVNPVLSFFALFLNQAQQNYQYFWIEFVCIVTITYLCICAYYTIFKIRIFNYYYLASHHQTDENSLIFCGMLLCRLTPPLCLNFLGLIHKDTHVTKQNGLEETFYTQIMGHMDVIPFISNGFNIYFPIAIVLLCAATLLNLGSRCLHFLGFQQFIGDDDMTQEMIDEGRQMVKRELRNRQRKQDGDTRRRNWNERFGGGASIRENSHTQIRKDGRQGASVRYEEVDDNDRVELLRPTDPVDFVEEDFTASMGSQQYQGYQSQSTSSYSRPPPPKSIFDGI